MLVRHVAKQADGLLELTVETRGRRPSAGDRLVLPMPQRGMITCELLSCAPAKEEQCTRLVVAAPTAIPVPPRQVGLISRATVWSGNLELPYVASGRLVSGLWYVPDSYGTDPINIALAERGQGLCVYWRRYPNSYKILAGAERTGSPFARRTSVTMGEVLGSAWYQRYLQGACQTGSAVLQGSRLACAQDLLAALQAEGEAYEPVEDADGIVLATVVGNRAMAFEAPLDAREGCLRAAALARLLLECAGSGMGLAGPLSA